MIKVNFKDGTTLAFDLHKEEDKRQWDEWSMVSDFQQSITGIGILHDKKFHTIPVPKRFHRIQFYAELVFKSGDDGRQVAGERIVCHADEVKMELMIYTHKNPPPPMLSRISMMKIGKQVFPAVKTGIREL